MFSSFKSLTPYCLQNCSRLNFAWSHSSFARTLTMSANMRKGKEIQIDTPFGPLAAKLWNESGYKTPILALHGWMDNAGTWDHLIPYLDHGHKIVAFDFPGHGLSPPPPYGLGAYLADNIVTIQRVLNHLEWQKVILMGHSMGGASAMLYAGTMPDVVQKLIMVDVIKGMHVDEVNQPEMTAKSIQGLLEMDSKLTTEAPRYEYEDIVKRLVKNYDPSLNEEAAKTLLIRGGKQHDDGKYSFRHSPILKVKSTMSMSLKQIEAFASNISCDLLLIKASSGPAYSTKEETKMMLDIYNNSSRNFVFEVVEGNHHFHMINPEPVAKLINSFLLGLPQKDSTKSISDYLLRSNL